MPFTGGYTLGPYRYPQLGGRQQISIDGGTLPRWSADGRELYFMTLDPRQIMAVQVTPGPDLRAGRPQTLFKGEFLPGQTGLRPYDVGRDGRFVIVATATEESPAPAAPNVVVVQHWPEELRRLDTVH